MAPSTAPSHGPTPNQLFAGCQYVQDAGGFDGFVGEVLAEVQTTVTKRLRGHPDVSDDKLRELLGGVVSEIVMRRVQADLKREIREVVRADLTVRPLGDGEDMNTRLDAIERRVLALSDLRIDALQRAMLERNPFGPTGPDAPDSTGD